MKRAIGLGILLFLIICGLALVLGYTPTITTQRFSTPTQRDITDKYLAASGGGPKVHILVMPGHEPGFGGAVYENIYERDLTVQIGKQLVTYLSSNPNLDVTLARTQDAWNPLLNTYFKTQWSSINHFVTIKKLEMRNLIHNGQIINRENEDHVAHAAAADDAARRLYGINKWANEHDIDLVVHIHLNDTPDHGPHTPSSNSGFAVYVPDFQYGNAATSFILGTDIAARISAMNATSTLRIEDKGVVPDQELIALGAYNTLHVPSVLIEYAYITEPRFSDPNLSGIVTKDFAYETYLGIQDFLGDSIKVKYPTASLPYHFTASTTKVGNSSPQIYAVQAAFHTLSEYPFLATSSTNKSSTIKNCSISGLMGPCTVSAIKAFQKSNGLEVTGTLGSKTLAALNAAFDFR